jgi:O-antigen/teichoic acid export membrane protein
MSNGHGTSSLKSQYLYKLGTSFLALPINLGLQALIPRALGPTFFGSYSFITAYFNSIVGFLDSGLSLWIYNTLCAGEDQARSIGFFWRVFGIVSLTILGLIAVSKGVGLADQIWPDQYFSAICLGAVFALANWAQTVCTGVFDSFGLTRTGEVVRLCWRILNLGIIALLFWTRTLNLDLLLSVLSLSTLCLLVAWNRALGRYGRSLWPRAVMNWARLSEYARQMWSYCHPLFAYALAGMAFGIVDRWLLQWYGGSIEQGFYGLSNQVSTASFLLTGGMTPLLMREFTKAYVAKDEERIRRDFLRFIPLFFALSAFISIFVASQAHSITLLFGGRAFQNAEIPVMIMSLYPIHQTYGQLSGSLLYSTGRTGLSRNIGICSMLAGIFVTLWLIGPTKYGGLELGAVGLAVKTVIVQLIGVLAQLWFNTKYLNLSFAWFLRHQAKVMAVFAILAFTCSSTIKYIGMPVAAEFVFSGVAYTAICALMICAYPKFFGIEKAILQTARRQILAFASLIRSRVARESI